MDGTQSFPEIVKLLIENGLQSTLILFFLTLIFGLILGMIIAKGKNVKASDHSDANSILLTDHARNTTDPAVIWILFWIILCRRVKP